ncbi:MAG TPA: cytochrome c biogenesis protein CcdA [Acidimicrobiales bacterium]
MIDGIGPDGSLALYLTLGMVATVNPCGFAMLPAYLAYFLGLEGSDAEAPQASVGQAIRVAVAVAAGFLAVFALAGAAVELTSLPVYRYSAWISIVIGLGLVVLGVAMLFGFELVVRLPRLDRGGRERTLGSMFVFGVSYAVASVGCTLPLFLGAVAGTINRESFVDGMVVFGIYASGMALVLVALTVSMALARTSIVRFLRRAQPYVGRVAGGLVTLAGAYVAYYGGLALRTRGAAAGTVPSSNIVDVVTGWSDDVTQWVDSTGAVRIAIAALIMLGLVLLAGTRARRRPPRAPARAGRGAGADVPAGG